MLCVSNTVSQCVFTFCTFSNPCVCVCLCECNRRCEALATHSGKYLGWFPSECLGVPMECPPPHRLLLPSLAVAPSRLRRGEGEWENGGTHKFDPCFVTAQNGACTETAHKCRQQAYKCFMQVCENVTTCV